MDGGVLVTWDLWRRGPATDHEAMVRWLNQFLRNEIDTPEQAVGILFDLIHRIAIRNFTDLGHHYSVARRHDRADDALGQIVLSKDSVSPDHRDYDAGP